MIGDPIQRLHVPNLDGGRILQKWYGELGPRRRIPKPWVRIPEHAAANRQAFARSNVVITEALAPHCRRGAASAARLDMLTNRNAHKDTLTEKIKK